jgi:hypothetical protein
MKKGEVAGDGNFYFMNLAYRDGRFYAKQW